MKTDLIVVLLLSLLGLSECQRQTTPNPKKDNVTVYPDDLTQYVYNYRVVNWCVTGNNEPALYEWPLVQFKPFLTKTSKYQTPGDFVELNDTNFKVGEELEDYEEQVLGYLPDDVNVTAELSFKKFWCDGFGYEVTDKSKVPKVYDQNVGVQWPQATTNPNSGIRPVPSAGPSVPFPYEFIPLVPIGHHQETTKPGTPDGLYFQSRPAQTMGHHLHQRIHIELKLTNTDDDVPFYGVEGILIQANHAPFGLGFPFGQFYRGEDSEDGWPCNCRFKTHRIIPCLSRPDVEILAPTVAAFHYQMYKYDKKDFLEDWDYPKKKYKIGRQKEFHFNFKWHSHPCASANIVEFVVLIVHDFYRRRYEIKKFGPYDFSPIHIHKDAYPKFGVKGGDRTHLEAKDSEFNTLRWLVPLSHRPDTNPVPAPGTFLDRELTRDGSRTGYVQNPLYMPSPIFPHCRIRPRNPDLDCAVPEDDPTTGQVVAKEIPNNYCQDEYMISCHDTPVVFPQMWSANPKKSLFDEWKERAYTGYFVDEVPFGPGNTATRTEATETKAPSIRFNGIFDVNCITRYPLEREAHRQCPDWTGKFRCDIRYNSRGNRHTFKEIIDSNLRMQSKVEIKVKPEADQFFSNTFCEPCKYEPTTPLSIPPPYSPPIFKRSGHGALMMLAFLYIMPVSMLIARHYKETLHTWESKGFRLWLWVHIASSIFAMLLAYTAYNLNTFWLLDRHIWLGYGAMFCGGAGIITGWGRHKHHWARKFIMALHSIPSYAAVVCAGACYFWSPVSIVSSWVLAASLIGMATIFLAMDCSVIIDDRRVGMHPRRSHFPVLQVRFEDAISRRYKAHWMFLCFIAVIHFLLIVITMFI